MFRLMNTDHASEALIADVMMKLWCAAAAAAADDDDDDDDDALVAVDAVCSGVHRCQ